METSPIDADTDRAPFVIVTVEYFNGQTEQFFLGEREEYYTWLVNPDRQLVFKTHKYTNRTVVPLDNVRAYHVNRSDAKTREGHNAR